MLASRNFPVRLAPWRVLLRAPHRQGVCSILKEPDTLSGVELGCILATAGARGGRG